MTFWQFQSLSSEGYLLLLSGQNSELVSSSNCRLCSK